MNLMATWCGVVRWDIVVASGSVASLVSIGLPFLTSNSEQQQDIFFNTAGLTGLFLFYCIVFFKVTPLKWWGCLALWGNSVVCHLFQNGNITRASLKNFARLWTPAVSCRVNLSGPTQTPAHWLISRTHSASQTDWNVDLERTSVTFVHGGEIVDKAG